MNRLVGRKMSSRRKASTRWKDGPEKAFRVQDIQMKESTAKDEQLNKTAMELLAKSLEKQLIENEVATFIKQGFDSRHGGSWNVIVGRNFGSHLTCTEHIHLTIAKISIIIFRLDHPPQHKEYR